MKALEECLVIGSGIFQFAQKTQELYGPICEGIIFGKNLALPFPCNYLVIPLGIWLPKHTSMTNV